MYAISVPSTLVDSLTPLSAAALKDTASIETSSTATSLRMHKRRAHGK